MPTNNPILSVLMTSYNRELYIAEAIESVLLSTYKDFELIIVDDCSKDMTVAIAKGYAAKDNRIQVFVNEKNTGQFSNRNLAANYASGSYIMYVDSDDMTYPESFEYCINQMLKDTKADMGMLCRIPELCEKILAPDESIAYHFFKKQFLIIGPGGTIIKKSFFDNIKQYPLKYEAAGDMYFNLKAASKGFIKCLCKEFLYYRTHEAQELNNEYSYLYNNYLYTKDAFDELHLHLSAKQINTLKKKSKRRFVVNLFKFLIKTKDFNKTKWLVNKTKFTFKDALEGIFHK